MQIMSWEFCSRRHDEYITRRFLTPQVEFLDHHALPVLHILDVVCSFLQCFYQSVYLFFTHVARSKGRHSTSLPNYKSESVAVIGFNFGTLYFLMYMLLFFRLLTCCKLPRSIKLLPMKVGLLGYRPMMHKPFATCS